MFKRVVSLLLVLVMMTGMIPVPAGAAETDLDTGNLSVESNNSLGSLLSDEIEQYQAEEKSGAYGVVGLTVSGNTATVEYSAMEEAKVVVAIYTEDGIQMLTSGTKTVGAGEGLATVTIAGTMPEYFMAEAFLVDTYDYSPLCTSYSTPIYTRSMQELLASDVNDYEEELVLNLDSDENTNFLVYDAGTIRTQASEGVNTVLSVNNETLTYVIGNADDAFLWLQPGDVVSHTYGNDQMLFAKVASVEVEGTTVTIHGAELDISDVFSHIKIEDGGMAQNAEIDASTSDMAYLGVSDAAPVTGTTLSDKNATLSKYLNFSDDTTQLGVQVDLVFNYYETPDNEHMELRTDVTMTASFRVEEKVEIEKRIGNWKFPLAMGSVTVVCQPKLVATFTGAIELSVSMTFTTGFTYGEAQGFKELKAPPQMTTELKAECTIFVGLDLNPGVDVLLGTAKVRAAIPVGVEAVAKRSFGYEANKESGAEMIHGCAYCLEISLDFKADFRIEVEMLFTKKKSFNIIGVKTHLLDMYFSLDRMKGGKGKCSNRKYLTTILVKDSDSVPVAGAKVYVDNQDKGKTNKNGVLTCYLVADTHTIAASRDSYQKTESVTIKEARTVELKLPIPKETKPPETEPVTTEPGETQPGGSTEPTVPTESTAPTDPTVPTETPDDGVPGVFGDVQTSTITRPGDILYSYTNELNVAYVIYSSGLMVVSGWGPLEFPSLSYSGSVKEIRIQEGFTEIPDNTFFRGSFDDLEKITIPKSVSYIGKQAFYQREKLKNVKINSTTLEIGQSAFALCENLTSIYLPDSTVRIGGYAFMGCENLASVRIPDSISTIEPYTFYGCSSLRNMTIPDTVTSIGEMAFGHCSSLRRVTIPDSVTDLGYGAFYACEALNKVVLPDHITIIPENCFGWTALESIDIPEGVTEIGDYAFAWCKNLDKVKLPESLEVIGNYAFDGCEEIKTIDIPDSVTAIGEYAFDQTGLQTISIPGGIELGVMAFAFTPMEEVWFEGDCPTVVENEEMPWLQVFQRYGDTMLTGFYPAGNTTWTWQNLPMGLSNFTYHPYNVNAFGERIVDWDSYMPYDENELSGFVPEETVPTETVPEITEPQETVPEETLSEETVPAETVTETVPAETEIETVSEETETSVPAETEPEVTEAETEPETEAEEENILMAFFSSFALRASAAEAEELPEPESTEAPVTDEPEAAQTPAVEETESVELLQPEKVLPKIPEMPVRPKDPEIPAIPEDFYDTELDAIFGGEYEVEEGPTYSLFTAAFSGLVPGEEYVLLDMLSVSVADPLAPDNLLAIRQGTADSSGYLVFEYAQREDSSDSYIVACGPSTQNVEEAFVIFPDMEADGELQAVDPVVEYYGSILKEGRDYILLGQVSFTKGGTYTCYVRGIQNYTGLVACTYTVEDVKLPRIEIEGPASVNGGSSVTLTAAFSYEPEEAAEITWSLAEGDEAWASLTPNGNSVTVTTQNPEEAKTVTVTASAEGKALPGTFTLTIQPCRILAEKVVLYQDIGGVLYELTSGNTWYYYLEGIYVNGLSINLRAVVSPEEANGQVVWSSSNPSVATIDPQTGVAIFGSKAGVTTFRATTVDGSGVYGEATFETRAAMIPEGSSRIELLSGKNTTLKVKDQKTGKIVSAKEITWSVDADGEDPEAYVTLKNGKLTAKKVLTRKDLRITAEITRPGPVTYRVEYDVTVYPAVSHVSLTEGGSLVNGKTWPMDTGAEPMTLTAELYPLDAMEGITWTVSDKKEVFASYTVGEQLDDAGKRTYTLTVIPDPTAKPGTVTVQAVSTDGSKKSASVKLQFGVFADKVEINKSLITMTAGDQAKQLEATMEPAVVSKPGIVWSLKNPGDKNYVSLSASGKIQPKNVLAPVDVTVVATSKDGEASDEHTIRILPKRAYQLVLLSGEQYITKTTQTLDVNTQQSITISAQTYGEEAMTEVTWSPLNHKSAEITLNDDGTLTVQMIAAGSITVNAKTADNRKASVTIKGVKMAQNLEIFQKKTNNRSGLELASGKSLDLQAVLTGAAGNKVTWTVEEGEQFAAVNTSGKVTAAKDLIRGGRVVVRATAADGSGATDTIDITVRPLAQGVQAYTVENGRQTFSIDSDAGWWVRSNTVLTWDLSTSADSVELGSRVYPFYDAADDRTALQTVTWKSSSNKIADVKNGVLEFYKTGSVTLTATAADGSGQKVSFKVNVVKTITHLTVEDQTMRGGKSQNLTKYVTIAPADATNKKLDWTILSGGEYATIKNGTFKAAKVTQPQQVRVRVSAQDGDAFADFTVTINP